MENLIQKYLDNVTTNLEICVKNRKYSEIAQLSKIAEMLDNLNINSAPITSLTQVPETKDISTPETSEVAPSQPQQSFSYDEKPKRIDGRNLYSVSHDDVWNFVIDFLRSENNECKSTYLADAFENKYSESFNSHDLIIKSQTDKRGYQTRKTVNWKQRLWSVTSKMRKEGIIIGDKDNLYVLAPKYRLK
jgi:hypothetical protein